MTGRGRGGGRFGRSSRGGDSRDRGGGGGGGSGGGTTGRDAACACEANVPLLVELKSFDEECLRTGKVKLRHGLMRAMKSVQRYPLPITTEKEACALEGVGGFTARRMLRGLLSVAPAANDRATVAGGGNKNRTTTDAENIEPARAGSSRSSSSVGNRTSSRETNAGGRVREASSAGCLVSSSNGNTRGLLRMNLRVRSCGEGGKESGATATATATAARPLSLASNFAALRGGGVSAASGCAGAQPTLDVTPKRPTSRARREGVAGDGDGDGDDDGTVSGGISSSRAPDFFSGEWEARLLVDNRENDFMSMQSSLLQRGVRCETRQLPLGDMLWIARRRDDPTSEVLLGYIVERKTTSDLASSIIDGRYDEQKRRLKLSGLRRRIYLVEGNINHQNILAPATLRTALTSSQASGGLAVVQCDSLRDSVDFLARTHRHIVSLLSYACRCSSPSGGGGGGGGGAGGGGGTGGFRPSGSQGAVWEGRGAGAVLRPAMTYGEYAQGCAKRAAETSVRQLLGAMMRQIPGCSAARAQALVQVFDSPLGLMLALERVAGGYEEGGMKVDDASRVRKVDDWLTELPCRAHARTNKLPQPLRRLLCRLFVGESVDGAGGDVGVEVADSRTPQSPVARRYCAPSELSGSDDPYRDWNIEPMNQDDPYL